MSNSISRSTQPVDFDERNPGPRFGLILLATDLTTEADLWTLTSSARASLHATRIKYANPTTPENLGRMAPDLAAAASLLVPGEALDAIVYSCTAASVVIGDEAVTDAIGTTRPGVPVVTPTGAARNALQALCAKRISVLTPYTLQTSEPMAAYFSAHGFDIVEFHCLGIDDDRRMARVCDSTITEAACAAVRPETEAIFISCTALPAIGCIGEIERRTGKPVVTSNQATAWAMLAAAGAGRANPGYGRLFEGAPRAAELA